MSTKECKGQVLLSKERGFYSDALESSFRACKGRGGTLLCMINTCHVAPWGGSYRGGTENNSIHA